MSFNGRFLDCTTAQYHADPCETPSLSASIATEMIQRSPLHAWQMHPRLGGVRREATDATNGGTLHHALLLGAGAEQLAVLDVNDFRTNAAKAVRDEALAAGKTVIKKADFDEAQNAVEKIKERMAALGIVLDGTSEEKVEWVEETEEDGFVICRGMLDHLIIKFDPVAQATVYDVKTIRSADLRTIRRHIFDYGYEIQEAAYRSAVGAISPEARGRIDFVFLFAEIDPPYAVTPIRLEPRWTAIGEMKWERAVRTWARCLKTKTWPAYVEAITQIDAPPWALE